MNGHVFKQHLFAGKLPLTHAARVRLRMRRQVALESDFGGEAFFAQLTAEDALAAMTHDHVHLQTALRAVALRAVRALVRLPRERMRLPVLRHVGSLDALAAQRTANERRVASGRVDALVLLQLFPRSAPERTRGSRTLPDPGCAVSRAEVRQVRLLRRKRRPAQVAVQCRRLRAASRVLRNVGNRIRDTAAVAGGHARLRTLVQLDVLGEEVRAEQPTSAHVALVAPLAAVPRLVLLARRSARERPAAVATAMAAVALVVRLPVLLQLAPPHEAEVALLAHERATARVAPLLVHQQTVLLVELLVAVRACVLRLRGVSPDVQLQVVRAHKALSAGVARVRPLPAVRSHLVHAQTLLVFERLRALFARKSIIGFCPSRLFARFSALVCLAGEFLGFLDDFLLFRTRSLRIGCRSLTLGGGRARLPNRISFCVVVLMMVTLNRRRRRSWWSIAF